MGDATPEDVIEAWGTCRRCHQESVRLVAHGAMCQPCLDAASGLTVQDIHERIGMTPDELAAAGYAVVPQRDVDAAARLRAAIERHQRDIHHAAVTVADQELWAAAAVGSVDPEPPEHWCTCPPDVCRGIGPDEQGCGWCWAKDTDEPCPNAAVGSVDPAGEAADREAAGRAAEPMKGQAQDSFSTSPARPSVCPEGNTLADIFTAPPDPELLERLRSDLAATDEALSGPAWPSVCPTCGSDDPAKRLEGVQPAPNRRGWVPVTCPDSWHSPDRGDR